VWAEWTCDVMARITEITFYSEHCIHYRGVGGSSAPASSSFEEQFSSWRGRGGVAHRSARAGAVPSPGAGQRSCCLYGGLKARATPHSDATRRVHELRMSELSTPLEIRPLPKYKSQVSLRPKYSTGT
jgi:hypothetical protein